MTVKVKYSNSYKAKMTRIKRLPVVAKNVVSGGVKRDLLEINKIFHDGIQKDELNLQALADITVNEKERLGYPQPDTPLYGAGDDEGERSYSNMMVIKKEGNSWTMKPSQKYHHKAKMSLARLFKIHEFGATIKKGDQLIVIPPRPALLLSWRKWLKQRKKSKKETSKEVKKAIVDYINKGSKELEKLHINMAEKIKKES